MQDLQNVARYFKGQNVMTPDRLEYGKIQGTDLIYELAQGDWLNKPIFGVTVMHLTGDVAERTKLSQGGFASITEARQYIATLIPQAA